MRLAKRDIVSIVIASLLIVAAITIASLTIGRDIYYGSRDEGLLSFAIVNASGYLFFLFMPVEVAFVYYLQGEINVFALNAVAMGTALFSQTIDYLIGFSFSNKFIDRLIGRRRYERAEANITKYGNLTIFVFNALPLSSPVISLAAGMMRHRVRDTVIYTVTGLLVKYLAMTLIF
ncbi:MAG: VTT domain-containing protein [Bacteroidota bacterium]|jgi:membrane protein DedA with SNARE-associated domain|nr:VTT domain-containing protein [Bacteroidota bacterium]